MAFCLIEGVEKKKKKKGSGSFCLLSPWWHVVSPNPLVGVSNPFNPYRQRLSVAVVPSRKDALVGIESLPGLIG